jgi:Autotransporter beta-domain
MSICYFSNQTLLMKWMFRRLILLGFCFISTSLAANQSNISPGEKIIYILQQPKLSIWSTFTYTDLVVTPSKKNQYDTHTKMLTVGADEAINSFIRLGVAASKNQTYIASTLLSDPKKVLPGGHINVQTNGISPYTQINLSNQMLLNAFVYYANLDKNRFSSQFSIPVYSTMKATQYGGGGSLSINIPFAHMAIFNGNTGFIYIKERQAAFVNSVGFYETPFISSIMIAMMKGKLQKEINTNTQAFIDSGLIVDLNRKNTHYIRGSTFIPPKAEHPNSVIIHYGGGLIKVLKKHLSCQIVYQGVYSANFLRSDTVLVGLQYNG